MNANYIRGVRKERKIKTEYEKNGWICLRSAGSHGFADVVCIHPEKEIIRFIQCKPESMSNKKKEELTKMWNERIYGEDYQVDFIVV